MKQLFFLGSTSASGFSSKFINLIKKDGYYTYILKGGPGTGKSTLIKKICKEFDDEDMEVYHCSSDVNSLDAVILNNRRIIVVDGTSPHVFEAEFPGVYQEIVNLGMFWNKPLLLENGSQICSLFKENSRYHLLARRYIQASSSLNSNILSITSSALLKEKEDKFTDNFINKNFVTGNCTGNPYEFRQLSAFTSSGYTTLPVSDEYKTIILKDDNMAGANRFLKKLASAAAERKYNVIISMCSAVNEEVYEHLLIPQLRIAFISSNFINKIKPDNQTVINFDKFYDKKKISEKKVFISFNKKVIEKINTEVASTIDIALTVHNDLEKYYINSLDTKKLNSFSENFINEIKNKIEQKANII